MIEFQNKSFEEFKQIMKDNPVKLGGMITLKKEDCLCNGCIYSHPIILDALRKQLDHLHNNPIEYKPLSIDEWDVIIPERK